MKSLPFILAATALAFAATQASAQTPPTKVAAKYDSVYFPVGFDSNDVVQIVGEGMFQNSCYRPAENKVVVNKEKKEILIGPAAYQYPGFCLQVVLPFERVMEVGILEQGTYRIVQLSDGKVLGSLDIKRALTDSPDDFIYAPISQAFFRQKGMKSQIYITGDFPNSCMSLKETRVDVQEKSIVVQPIAEMRTGTDCKNGKFHFEDVVDLDMVPAGRYLFHVRSMNAKSINNLVEVK